jgi:hypothetical protein
MKQAATMTGPEFIQAQVRAQLQEALAEEAELDAVVPAPAQKHPTEVSPWLELTQWPRYLQGQSFTAVAALAALPDPTQEPLLVAFAGSVKRLIDRAYRTIADRRINEFDQVRINTFVPRPGIWNRPIQIHLKPSTYQRYRQVWQRLICFAYRTSRPDQPIALLHQLTTAQLAALDQMEEHAARLVLDPARQTFHEPYGYIGHLSGLVKMGQMLVVEQAVQMADEGLVTHPSDALDSMREHFLIYGVRAPFAWITRLRTYGKKVQNTTTSLGYIYWSDDEQTLTYKELRLSMGGLRQFICTKVALAQLDLECLFLLYEEESREAIIPTLELQALHDDPTNN